MLPRRVGVFLLVLFALPAVGQAGEPRFDAQGDPLPPGAVARLGKIRLRHGGSINRLLFSPDGKRLVSWGGTWRVSKGIAIWEAATGKELRWFSQPGAWLEAWAWLPDGRGIAVLESDDRHFLCDFSAATAERQSARNPRA